PPPIQDGSVAAFNPSPTAMTISWSSGGGSTDYFLVAIRKGNTPPTNCEGGTRVDLPEGESQVSHTFDGLEPNANYAFAICSVTDGVVSLYSPPTPGFGSTG